MRRTISILLPLALLFACAKTVVVSVPPRMDLKRYDLIGIVDFSSNAERGVGARAARQFMEQVQQAQAGTRFIELGDRDALMAAIGARQLDPAALRQIGQKHGVAAVFVGELLYSEPTVDVKLADVSKLQGAMRADVRGDISSRLLETATGASVWSSSAWARRQIGGVHMSGQGVSGGMRQGNPHEAILPTLVHHLTHDFRPSTERQPAR